MFKKESKRLKRILLGLGFVLGVSIGNLTVSEAGSKAIYFDARLNMGANRLDVVPKEDKLTGGRSIEDKYVAEYTVSSQFGNAGEYTQKKRSGKTYKEAMDPDKEGEPYKNTNGILGGAFRESLEKYVKQFSVKRGDAANSKVNSKKNTIPAAIYYFDENGTKYASAGLKKEHNRAKILMDAICGEEDRGEKGPSMVQGFNILLEKIGVARGGYDDDTFKETVKGLTWLLSQDKDSENKKVVFEVSNGGSLLDDNAVDEEDEGEDAEVSNTTDASKDDYEGNGGDITVEVISGSDYKKEVVVTQDGAEGELCHFKQIWRLSTGYTVVGDISDYGEVQIKITDAEMSKGLDRTYYTAGGALSGLEKEDIEWITLYDLVMDAFIKLNDNVTSDGAVAGVAGSDNWLTGLIVGVANDLVSFIEDEMGMDEIEDLVYNKMEREFKAGGSDYLLGMFPNEWMTLIKQGLSVTSTIGVLFLLFAILRVFYLMNLDAMNVGARINLKEDIKNVIYTVFGMMFFATAFYVMGVMNHKLTTVFYTTLGDESVDFVNTFTLGSGAMTSIVLRLVLLGVKAYVNVIYIVRGINIALLLILAPIFIIGTAFLGPERIKVFAKELAGNIFLQAFHALVILFIAKAKMLMTGLDVDSNNFFVSVVMVTSIIPVTSMFKELVFGSSKSLLSAGRIAGQAKHTVMDLGRRSAHMASHAGKKAGQFGVNSYIAGSKLSTMDEYGKFREFKERQRERASMANGIANQMYQEKARSGDSGQNKEKDDEIREDGTNLENNLNKNAGYGEGEEVIDNNQDENAGYGEGDEVIDNNQDENINTNQRVVQRDSNNDASDDGEGEEEKNNNDVPQYSKYYDENLAKSFDNRSVKKVKKSVDIANMVNYARLIRSGSQRDFEAYYEGKRRGNEFLSYVRENRAVENKPVEKKDEDNDKKKTSKVTHKTEVDTKKE